jgi:hypothetical protein
MSYSKIIFTGNYSLLTENLKTRIPDIKFIKQEAESVIIKIDSSLLDDLYYLKGLELEDNTKILDFEEVTSFDEEKKKENEEKVSSKEEIISKIHENIRIDASFDPNQNLEKAIKNTILRSKVVLPDNHSFNYFLSSCYLLGSSIVISSLVFISSALF